mmetsp:Transcript_50644/g.147319  ORF Transcript_50644/g.147319 Transcript_50644/m.147319 type:complete len:201 (-) Transcript_50644:202-804(-)
MGQLDIVVRIRAGRGGVGGAGRVRLLPDPDAEDDDEVNRGEHEIVPQPLAYRGVRQNLQEDGEARGQAEQQEGGPVGRGLIQAEGHAPVLLAGHVVRQNEQRVAAQADATDEEGGAASVQSDLVEAEHEQSPRGQEASEPKDGGRGAPPEAVAHAAEHAGGHHGDHAHPHAEPRGVLRRVLAPYEGPKVLDAEHRGDHER